jgi:thiol-disulfide isomerase/thioredoxin
MLGVLQLAPLVSVPTELKLAGKVVDAAGAPVAGVNIASDWHWGPQGFSSERATVSAADGGFTLSMPVSSGSVELLALDVAGDRGGFAAWTEGAFDRPATVVLLPCLPLRANVVAPEGVPAPDVTASLKHSMAGGAWGAELTSRPPMGPLELHLPPGDYSLMFAGADIDCVFDMITLAAGQASDMGDFQLTRSVMSKYAGKPPPEFHVTDARGVPATMKLSDFKGKWVLLDFWGFWCRGCVADGMPRLIELYEKHADQRERFVILAVHDVAAKTFDELAPHLEQLQAELWHGKPLPFPIVLDSTGQTVKNFGIRSWPTEVLIDPEGHVVRGGDDAMLEEKLAAER